MKQRARVFCEAALTSDGRWFESGQNSARMKWSANCLPNSRAFHSRGMLEIARILFYSLGA